jgi:ABC-type lipoprotein release transport system permease subunit
MTFWTLILRFHARAHAGVVLGAAIGSAALIGALVVGDSVRESLTNMALRRLGNTHFALNAQDRLFQTSLGPRLRAASQPDVSRAHSTSPANIPLLRAWPQSSALALPGIVARQDGAARANHVNVFGVDARTWPRLADWGKLSPDGWGTSSNDVMPDGAQVSTREFKHGQSVATRWEAGETAFINETLARQLAAREGDEIIVRVRKPSALGLDAAISPRNEDTVAVRLKVGAILTPDMLGDFGLAAQPAPPANLFLPLEFLTNKLGVHDQANLLVTGPVLAPTKSGRGYGLRLLVTDPVLAVTNREEWDDLRFQVAWWLWTHAPRLRAGQTGAMSIRSRPDPSSLAGRAARALMPKAEISISDKLALPWLNAELARAWLPEDAALSVRTIEQPQNTTGGDYIRPFVEVTSSRIFLEPSVVTAALRPRTILLTNREAFAEDRASDVAFAQFVTNGVRVLTYLANLMRAGTNATPYSMVTAASGPFVPPDMRDDEILVNQWLADDLRVKPGDSVELSYYLVDSGSRLVERTNSFRVRQIVPLAGIYADRTLMPEFPGLAKAESTHDWDAGFPLVYPIRTKDEAYWKAYRGTPKAFVTLAAGQAMWANRFGVFTAIRYDVPTNALTSTCHEAVYRNLLANLKPADVGLQFEPVRAQALKSAAQSQDFGQLFLGFSIFLVVAALLLMALLFQFGLEQRAAEVGTLLALGFTPKQVRRLFLMEGAMLALGGGFLGALGGLAYAKAMLWGLATVWRGAVSTSTLQFHATLATLVIGTLAGTVVAVLTIWLTLRKQARQPARELLAGEIQNPKSKIQNRGGWLALASGLAAVAIISWALVQGESANAGAFFGAGALLLLAGLGWAAAWFSRLARADGACSLHTSRYSQTAESSPSPPLEERAGERRPSFSPKGGEGEPPVHCPPDGLKIQTGAGRLTLSGLGVRGCARRRKRSLATVALLACGSFLIVAIGVFRLDANRDATKRASGTGGFALIGESTMPVVQDLNTRPGREFFGLGPDDLAGVNVVPLRVRAGDEASCLNLNRAQKPRLLGVKPELLAGRFTFANVAKGLDRHQGWELLRTRRRKEALIEQSKIQNPKSKIAPRLLPSAATGMDEIPAIGDANSIEWALGKKVGDTLDYTDEQGRAFKLRLVGAVANSILQGSLLIDEAEFVKRFPGESGCRMFLIDAPSNSVPQVSATLSRALQDAGLELTPAAERLNAFNAVQNTYLGTFQILGGLGLLLGSAGLGVVVLRNVLERRGELGLLVAVGFRRGLLRRLVLSEHGTLLGLGLGLGAAAAAVAVLPAILSPGTQLPYASLALTLAAVLLNGLLWTWLATGYALRGNLLATLRNE